MYQLVNQPVFDLLLPLLALSVTSNPQLQCTVTENKRLSYFILTNDTTPPTNNTTLLTDNTTPLTVETTPLIINTVIRAKSALYTVKLDISL